MPQTQTTQRNEEITPSLSQTLLLGAGIFILASFPLAGYTDELFPISRFPMYERMATPVCRWLPYDLTGNILEFGSSWKNQNTFEEYIGRITQEKRSIGEGECRVIHNLIPKMSDAITIKKYCLVPSGNPILYKFTTFCPVP